MMIKYKLGALFNQNTEIGVEKQVGYWNNNGTIQKVYEKTFYQANVSSGVGQELFSVSDLNIDTVLFLRGTVKDSEGIKSLNYYYSSSDYILAYVRQNANKITFNVGRNFTDLTVTIRYVKESE